MFKIYRTIIKKNMNRMAFRLSYLLACLATSVIWLHGCGNTGQTSGQPVGSRTARAIRQEESGYIAQPLTLPEYTSLDGAWSDGADLYYAASQYDQATETFTTSFHVLRQGAAVPEERFALAENQQVLHMAMDDGGHTYYVGYQYIPEADGRQTATAYFLYKLDAAGVPLLTLDLAEHVKGQDAAVRDLAVDGEGRIVLIGPDQRILVFSPDGSLLFETQAVGMILDICSSGGKVFLAYDELGQTVIRAVDMTAKKLAEKWATEIGGTNTYMAGTPDGDLLLATEEGAYRYGTGTGELVKKFDWQDHDFYGIQSGYLMPYGENGVLAVSRDWSYSPMKVEAVIFREAAEGEALAPEKTVLTINVPQVPPARFYDAVVTFNKANPDYKIETCFYESQEHDRLNAEILAGQGPDILMLPAERIDQLAYSGALVDLYPYFNEDKTFEREDFYINVITAFEQAGHLYGIPINYKVRTLACKSSLVGEKESWNLAELAEFTERYPDGRGVFSVESKSSVFQLLKIGYTGQLINLEDPEAPLDRELLMQMLEFANQYENDDTYIMDSNLPKRIYEEQIVLLDTYIYKEDVYEAHAALLGEPVTLIGYPVADGNGNLIYSENTFAISENCEHRDVAWSFISYLLSEEYQFEMADAVLETDLPVRRDAQERFCNLMLERTGYREISGLYFIASEAGQFSYQNWLQYSTEEDMEQFYDLIEKLDTAWRPSLDIDQIIEEEAAYYFNGDKPLEEVVDVIEDRIKTYVYEKQ